MFVENKRFKIKLNSNGIITSAYSKKDKKELIINSNPIRVLIDNDNILLKSTSQVSTVDKNTIVSKYFTNSTANYRVSVEIAYRVNKNNITIDVKVINLDDVQINCVVCFCHEVILSDLVDTKTVVNGRLQTLTPENDVELVNPRKVEVIRGKERIADIQALGYNNLDLKCSDKKEEMNFLSMLQIPSNSMVTTRIALNHQVEAKVSNVIKWFIIVILALGVIFALPAYKYIGYYYYVTGSYDGKVDKDYMEQSIFTGITQGLNNPYSSYLTDEQYGLLMNQSDIFGFALIPDANYNIMIGEIQANSEADKSSICPGDIIMGVDGEEVSARNVDAFYQLTQENKEYTFNIYRPTTTEMIDVKLSKAKPVIDTVSHKMYDADKKYGYIKITQFEDETIDQFKNALDAVKAQGMEELIIDVCDNPGGNVATVQAILSMLVKTDQPIFQFTRDGDVTQNYFSNLEEEFNYPIKVLQNQNSASASEILSLVLKEYNNAEVIGTKSYGKGTGQSIAGNMFGPGYNKITTFHWQSGKGTSIEGEGIEPTIEVKEQYDSIAQIFLTDMVTLNSQGKNSLLLNRYLYYLGYGTDPNSVVCSQTTINALNRFCNDNGLSAESKLTPSIAKVLIRKTKDSYNQPQYNPILRTALGQ